MHLRWMVSSTVLYLTHRSMLDWFKDVSVFLYLHFCCLTVTLPRRMSDLSLALHPTRSLGVLGRSIVVWEVSIDSHDIRVGTYGLDEIDLFWQRSNSR